MEKVTAFERCVGAGDIIKVSSDERLCGMSNSRGNQLKWKQGDKFIKLNCLGYEGIAEEYVSRLLACTDVPNFVNYKRCKIEENGVMLGEGCVSRDFVKGRQEITFGNILDANLMSYSSSYDDIRDIILDDTGVDVKNYMDTILCLDAITMNDDRHFHNFALLRDGRKYSPAPIFDNGSALLSDMIMYPMEEDLEVNMARVQAKPFSIDFLNQLYFVTPITIDVEKFFSSVTAETPEEKRALAVIAKRLEITKNIAWQEC